MVHCVWIIGVIITIWGITAVIKPNGMKNFVVFVSKGKLVYLAAALKILMGILFLVFARECHWPMVIIAIGILSAGGAAVFCLMPFSKIAAWLNWWKSRPVWMYRLWGIAAALFGILVMYAGFPLAG